MKKICRRIRTQNVDVSMGAVKTAMFIHKYSPREGHLHYSALFFFQGKYLKLTGFMQRKCWQQQTMRNSKAGANLQK
jgi:hypothetical protein